MLSFADGYSAQMRARPSVDGSGNDRVLPNVTALPSWGGCLAVAFLAAMVLAGRMAIGIFVEKEF
jgi:hypothetical protein